MYQNTDGFPGKPACAILLPLSLLSRAFHLDVEHQGDFKVGLRLLDYTRIPVVLNSHTLPLKARHFRLERLIKELGILWWQAKRFVAVERQRQVELSNKDLPFFFILYILSPNFYLLCHSENVNKKNSGTRMYWCLRTVKWMLYLTNPFFLQTYFSIIPQLTRNCPMKLHSKRSIQFIC